MQATSKGRAVAWVLLGLANIAGYAFNLYQRFWWFDRVLHAATTLAVALGLALFVFGKAFRPGYPALLVLMAASIGVAIGAVWEVAEWGFDQVTPGDVIKGKYDTMLDVVMDTIGAVIAGLLCLAFLQPPEPGDQP